MACGAALLSRGEQRDVVAANRLIPVRVGEIEIEIEAGARPDRVDVVAGEASLNVTLGCDAAARPAGIPPAGAVTRQAPGERPPVLPGFS
jgi:hypothetical protein